MRAVRSPSAATSATVNIAALIAAVALSRKTRILNAVAPDAPTVGVIGAAIMAALGRTAELIGTRDAPAPVGVTRWSVPRPFVFDDSVAVATG